MPDYRVPEKWKDRFVEMWAFWPTIKDVCNRVLRMTGPGVSNTPGGITILQPQKREVQRPPAAAAVRFAFPSSNRTKGGCYLAYLVTPATSALTVGSGTTFSGSDIGTATTTEITLVNLNEEDTTDHMLTAGTVTITRVPCWPAGRVDENGKPVYYCAVVDLKDC